MTLPRFAYYDSLGAASKRTYRKSDAILRVELPRKGEFTPIFERRSSNNRGELHGLYEPDEVTGGRARISAWMRTARKERVVKFRTFVRTLVHEACHHLDYELYKLPETFHTQGFYARESALVRDLLAEASRIVAP